MSSRIKLHRNILKKNIERIVDELFQHPGLIIDKIKDLFDEITRRYDSEEKSEWQIAYNPSAPVRVITNRNAKTLGIADFPCPGSCPHEPE